jgi:hypothetical protein
VIGDRLQAIRVHHGNRMREVGPGQIERDLTSLEGAEHRVDEGVIGHAEVL